MAWQLSPSAVVSNRPYITSNIRGSSTTCCIFLLPFREGWATRPLTVNKVLLLLQSRTRIYANINALSSRAHNIHFIYGSISCITRARDNRMLSTKQLHINYECIQLHNVFHYCRESQRTCYEVSF